MLNHNTINCAREGCYAIITLHPDDERRLRRTHETFYCPAGHANVFRGKTEEQKRIDELERAIAARNRTLDSYREEAGGLYDDRELLLMRERLCPLRCGWKTDRRPAGVWTRNRGEHTEALARYFERVEGDVRDHLLTDHQALAEPRKLLTERAGA